MRAPFCIIYLLLSCIPGSATAQQPQLVMPVGHTSRVLTSAFSPDGKYVLSSGNSPEAYLWETRTGNLIYVLQTGKSPSRYLEFSENGKWLITQSGDFENGTSIWEAETGKKIYTSAHYWNFLEGDSYYWDLKRSQLVLLASGQNSRVEYIDLKAGRLFKEFVADEGEVFLFISRDQFWILRDNRITLINVDPKAQASGDEKTKTVIGGFPLTDQYTRVSVSPAGHYLVVGNEFKLTIYDISKKAALKTFDFEYLYYSYMGYDNFVFSPDDRYLGYVNRMNDWQYRYTVVDMGTLKETSFVTARDKRSARYSYYARPVFADSSLFILAEEAGENDTSGFRSVLSVRDLRQGRILRSWSTDSLISGFQVDGDILWYSAVDRKESRNEDAVVISKVIRYQAGELIYQGKESVTPSNMRKRSGYFLTASDRDLSIHVYHDKTGGAVSRFTGKSSRPENLEFISADTLLAGNNFLNIRTGNIIKELKGKHEDDSGNGNYMAFVHQDSTFIIEKKTLYEVFASKGVLEDMDNRYVLLSKGTDSLPFYELWDYTGQSFQAGFTDSLQESIYDSEYDSLQYLVFKTGNQGTLVYNCYKKISWEPLGEFESLSQDKKIIITETSYEFLAYSLDSGKLVSRADMKNQLVLPGNPSEAREPFTWADRQFFRDIADTNDILDIEYSRKRDFCFAILRDSSVIARSRDRKITSAPFRIRFSDPEDRLLGSVASFFRVYKNKFGVLNDEDRDISFIIEMSTGRVFKLPLGNFESIYDCWFSTNDSVIFVYSRAHTVSSRSHVMAAWNFRAGKQLFSFGDGLYINHSFSQEHIALFVEGRIRIISRYDGGLIYDYMPMGKKEFLVTEPGGRYDGTPVARKSLYFTCGREVIELEQLKEQLWVPGLVERLMRREPINSRTLGELNICGLTPLTEQIRNDKSYHFRIKPRKGGLGETILYINGIEVMKALPGQLARKGNSYEWQLDKKALERFFIPGAENIVSLKAFISAGGISSRGLRLPVKSQADSLAIPNLYAVVVGVSNYKGEDFDLNYAARDAREIAKTISLVSRKLLNTDGREHVFVYELTTDSIRYQLPEKRAIKKVLEEIGARAQPNDILLIFFAGHGIMQPLTNQFYFMTADASRLTAASATADVGLSTAELTEWMKPSNIKAQKRVLILDACNSGQAIRDMIKIGKSDQGYFTSRNEDKARLIKTIEKLNERTGLFILSASASNQDAYELDKYSQGLLTYSLLKAIKEQPDILNEGIYLDLGRWFSAAEKNVTEVSQSLGVPQNPQVISNTNFNLGIVDDDVLSKIILPGAKPLFAGSSLQNADENIAMDDLEINKLLDAKLVQIASRGAEGHIVFSGGSRSSEAYAIGGRYEIRGENITARVNIRKGKEIRYRFEISGKVEKLNELATAITQKVLDLMK